MNEKKLQELQGEIDALNAALRDKYEERRLVIVNLTSIPGMTYEQIGAICGMTRARVAQIVDGYQKMVEDGQVSAPASVGPTP